jgi:alkaline phosphatase D
LDDHRHFRHPLGRACTRRDFLHAGAGAAGLILLGVLPAHRADASLRTREYPFTLGVASGDPTPTGVVLWTRLAPDPLRTGGMPPERVPVRWEVASDEAFRRVVQRGQVLALPELAHSVHVEVEGLAPDRVYWYRFISGAESSPIGRTRTAPAAGARLDHFALAFASCQNYEAGYYTAHRHLANEDVSLVVFLGDYIYEDAPTTTGVRRHTSPEIVTLDDYRARYALYKTDPDLQAAHAAFPWVVTWDDHEVDNNYAGQISERYHPVDLFLQRRAAAYQAYYEHMPIRRAQMPAGPDLRLYRRLGFGDLLELSVLDTRQYRSDQPCGDTITPPCAEASSPDATMLGAEQERWLFDSLGRSTARWNLVGNQLPLAEIDRIAGPTRGFQMDQWSGYVQPRDRLVRFLHERRVSNPIVITGDVHQNWVADVKVDANDPASATVATEFVGTSISSGGDGQEMTDAGRAILEENPHVRYYNAQRGYVRCTVTPQRWQSEYRLVPLVTRPQADVVTHASFVVESGRAGVQQG